MKFTLPVLFILLFSFMSCSSLEYVTKEDLMNEKDTTYLGLPYLRGSEMLKSLIHDYPFELPHYTGELETEGVVRLFVKIGLSGRPSNIKIVESVNENLDSLAISFINNATYVAPENITNVKGSYVLEVLFPFYNSNITKEKYSNLMSGESVVVPYGNPPEPVGGYGAIYKAVHYPELARKHGIEGTSIIQMLIDSSGNTGQYTIIEPMGYGLDDAAIRAVRDIKWVPAYREDKPISIRITIPVVFRLS